MMPGMETPSLLQGKRWSITIANAGLWGWGTSRFGASKLWVMEGHPSACDVSSSGKAVASKGLARVVVSGEDLRIRDV